MVLAAPRAASAQQVRPARIGILPQGSPSNTYDRSLVEAFREGLREVGLVENRDIILDVAWITGGHDQAVAELIQLIERGVKVLITSGSRLIALSQGDLSVVSCPD
jgi:putative ABC transport system substrate-binding protein